jgi:Papain fold toxin 1, glutamine deamidase
VQAIAPSSEAGLVMAGTDRPPGHPDAAPDARTPEGAATRQDRGAIADAGTRRECALAYRVTVDAVYAGATRAAAPEAAKPASAIEAARRPDMAERHQDRYTRPADPPPRVEGPGEHPARWVGDIYPGRNRHQRPNNCGECARAADSTWHGAPTAAAELANRRVGGERPAVMTEWAGRAPEPASMADIAQRLRELGPGSSAVVGFDREDAPGHWFNAVNHEGTVLAVDGQSGRFEDWPPSRDGLGFDESGMSYSDAVYFTPEGKVVRNDHQ